MNGDRGTNFSSRGGGVLTFHQGMEVGGYQLFIRGGEGGNSCSPVCEATQNSQ